METLTDGTSKDGRQRSLCGLVTASDRTRDERVVTSGGAAKASLCSSNDHQVRSVLRGTATCCGAIFTKGQEMGKEGKV